MKKMKNELDQLRQRNKELFEAAELATRRAEAEMVAKNDLRQRVAELEADNARLKTVPMKYRRMQFNAELQDENKELREQLAASQLREKQFRDALKMMANAFVEVPAETRTSDAIESCYSALDLPQDDSALREYLAGKMMPLVEALRTIANIPLPEQDNMLSANMRQVAREALEAARKEL